MAVGLTFGHGPLSGQTAISPSQIKQADFSGLPLTKPARNVTALPESCSPGEMVYLTAGLSARNMHVCSGGTWWPIADAVHGHALNEIFGVAGKKGNGDLLVTFGGGQASNGDCVQFDESGGLISTGAPCSDGAIPMVEVPNLRVAFTNQTTVTLTHGRDTLNVLIACYDAANRRLEPDQITLPDTNTAIVGFAVQQTGACVLNSSGGGSAGGGAVTSIFGRTGEITARGGDYTFSQINGFATVEQGGTGATTAVGARVNLLPAMSGQAGRFLKVNASGTDVEYASAATGGGESSYRAGTGIVIDGDEIGVSGSVPAYITGTASIADWNGGSDNVPAAACREKSFTLNGAVDGDAVIAGGPPSLPNGLSVTAYVGTTNIVVVRLCNATAEAISVPDGLTFRATIVRGF